MFQVVARHWKLIFFQLSSPKCKLGEVEKAMFQGLPCQFELIFGHLTIAKCELVEIEKSFQGLTWLFQHFFEALDQPKMRHG